MGMLERQTLSVAGLEALLDALKGRGYRVIGPTVRDQAIVYDDIASAADLPQGWTDEQDGGRYRLARRGDDALFGYAVGPHSWKKFLHPPVQRLWQARRDGEEVHVTAEPASEERFAFIGVRACELYAIAIQDRVFLGGPHVDPRYDARRKGTFIVAVNCGKAGGTCFCVSMGTGPKAQAGFDLALTEIAGNRERRFVVEVGTAVGGELLDELPHREATADDVAAADAAVAQTAAAAGQATLGHVVPPRILEVAHQQIGHVIGPHLAAHRA